MKSMGFSAKLLVVVTCMRMFIAPVQAAATQSNEHDRIILPATVTPTHYDLDVTPLPGGSGFSGNVSISVTVNQSTRQIVLNAADLQIKGFTVKPAGGAGKGTAVGTGAAGAAVRGGPKEVALDSQHETATFNLPSSLAPGAYILTIDYSGKINASFAGFFRVPYDTPKGPKVALFTQFENSDARRFMPCWDEPALKATFSLSVTVPADDMAVSNMPVASAQTLPDGKKHVSFAESPQMSTYLLFLGTGDFERVSRKVDGVDVGVVVKRGDTAKAQYALDAASQILPYYQQYFGVKYPRPKLDLLGGPGKSQFFSAMENWGAIFYVESALEFDPAISTESDRQHVYSVVAHEMAHQWFGDLVTMQWWDELWLNEGFASWMADKVTDHFHPEWQVPLQSLASKERALMRDAQQGTHPVVQPIRDVLQASEAFDNITYQKGFAVISMLEAYAGDKAFQAAVRQYIRKHAYGNTVSDDLWTELDQTAKQPISGIAHDFTLQAGVPLIKVVDQGNAVELHQERFAVDTSGAQAVEWHIPVVAQVLGQKDTWQGVATREHPPRITKLVGAAIVVNASQSGYFRTSYDPALLQPLIAHFGELSPLDQTGLLNDTHSLGFAGREPLSDSLEMAAKVSADSNAAVLRLVSDQLRDLSSRFEGMPGQDKLQQFIRGRLSPVFSRVGWEERKEDSSDVRLLRASLIATLSRLGDAKIVEEARSRFEKLRKDPTSVTAEVRQSVLSVIAENADAATWDQLHDMAKHAHSFLEKEQIYSVLGAARDRAIAQRTLELALTDEAPITLRPNMIATVANAHFPDLAFDFNVAHFAKINELLEPDSRNQFAARLLFKSNDAAMIPKLRAYTQARVPETARKEATVAEGLISYNSTIRTRRLPELDKWLAVHVAASK